MLDKFRYTAATDKDVFDLLMSGGAKLGRKALHDIARSRGFFFSDKAPKEEIASAISLWAHDYHSVQDMVQKREQASHNEKRSFVELPVASSKEELNTAVAAYKSLVKGSEEVSTAFQTLTNIRINVAYDQIDYSKTRLIQRQRKDSPIDIEIGESSIFFRMPANERSRRIVEGLCAQVRQIKLQDLEIKQISLQGLDSDERSLFFMSMCRAIEGYKLQTVISMKFANSNRNESVDEEEEAEETEAQDEIITRINSIAISGENLFQTSEYQQIRGKGFFFTALTWRSKQEAKPNDLMQFDVSFDDPQEGTGFKFGVRIAKNAESITSGDFQPLEANRQPSMWRLIERAANNALQRVRGDQAESRRR